MGSTSSLRAIVVGLAVIVCAFAVRGVAGESGPGVPEVVSHDEAAAITVVCPRLQPGDVVRVVIPGCPRAPRGGAMNWIAGAEVGRWSARVAQGGSAELVLDLADLDEGTTARVTISRVLDGGDTELQTGRSIHRDAGGALEIGPGSEATILRTVSVRLPSGAAERFPDLARDGSGWWRVPRTSPDLGRVLRAAVETRPSIHATVRTRLWMVAKDSVSGSNTGNGYFSDKICGQDPWWGTSITISTAPSGAVVTGFEDAWTVYHSVDISRFQAGLWHRDPPGGNWTDQIVLYTGTSSGDTVYHQADVGMHNYDGSEVNTEYIIGCCNKYGVETAYLDEWSITVYYNGGGGGVDLVADTVDPLPDTVAAGGALDLRYAGHVASSGPVGTPFTTGVYLSTNATISGSDRRIASLTESGSLDDGDTFGNDSWGFPVTIPADVAPGSYWIGVRVDDGDAVSETDETNNTAAAPLTVRPSSDLPDLVSSGCSVSPDHANAGETVRLSFRWRNTGATAAPSFVWEAFLSGDAGFSSDDTPLASMDGGGWHAGYDSGTDFLDLTLPAGLPDGDYFIGMAVDSTHVVPETDETNNVCTARLTVGAGGGGAVHWLIPAAASAPGYGGSNWKTEVSIVNPDTSAHTVTVHYIPKGQAWPGSVLTGPTSLGAGRVLYLDDPLLPLNPTTGALFVECDGSGPVVTTRTYNVASGGATFGQGIPAVSLSGTAPAAYVLPLVHSVPGRFHTNVGLVQTGSGPVVWTVTIHSTTGTVLGTRSYTRSGAFDQVNDVFADMGLGGISVEGGWIRVELVSGSPPYWTTYASVVDDRTGDPTYVVPVPQ